MNWIVNYIWYKICNSTVGFSNYKFNNKLLGVVSYIVNLIIRYRVILGLTWIQPVSLSLSLSLSLSIYIYIYIL